MIDGQLATFTAATGLSFDRVTERVATHQRRRPPRTVAAIDGRRTCIDEMRSSSPLLFVECRSRAGAAGADMFRLAWLTSRPIDLEECCCGPSSVQECESSAGSKVGTSPSRTCTMTAAVSDFPHLPRRLSSASSISSSVPGDCPPWPPGRQPAPFPIVFHYVDDPVGAGLVASLPRPGGNVTGLGGLWTGISGKMLELLMEAAPKATRIALLTDPTLGQQADFDAEANAVAQQDESDADVDRTALAGRPRYAPSRPSPARSRMRC